MIYSVEQRRLAQEEKEIEQEQRQLIRRKQLLLRKHKLPNLKRAFPVFTLGRNEYDDSESYNDNDGNEYDVEEEEEEYESDMNESDQSQTGEAEMTLKALSSKLSTLETELENMKQLNIKQTATNVDQENVEPNIQNKNQEEQEKHENENPQTVNTMNECDLTLDYESIEKTIQAAKQKKSSKPLHIKLPEMPNINISQPPQLSKSPTESTNVEAKKINIVTQQNEEKKMNAALNSLAVPSLLMVLDKLKIYFKEMQSEKKQNEEFRTTLLESVNAQNTQILHLLSSLASQQKQMDDLKIEVSSLKTKLQKYENSNVRTVANINNSDKPQWNNNEQIMISNLINNNDIALRDIKNVIEESRPNINTNNTNDSKHQIMLNNTDWRSISNVLQPKNASRIEYSGIPQQAYTIQRHQQGKQCKQGKRRSFIPSTISGEPMERIAMCPPQPVPKPKKKNVKKQGMQSFIEIPDDIQMNNSNYVMTNYPKVRVERFHR